ncbi:Protein N-acetyltransferase, RimJ/RimL family [Planococcus glaciei]|uniref:GNAT family N-acetyltransferase n=1 Tax=Planococcus glaciei TaxID=459472 RepID=UPI000883843E|nr:GNAT family N-acetyltransferase [Planococcus glaciei]SDI67657.1 Protein N-acetyltransferase, RimJ/RimL family [Planococcus glaciei]
MDKAIPEVPEEIRTERLLIRMPKPGDGKVVNAAIRASIKELKAWLPFAQQLPSVEETEINTVEAHLNFLKHENLRYLIFNKETGEFIGSSGFHSIEWEVPKMEIGYWIDTRWSGFGYMAEAVSALSELALDGFRCKRLEIRCDAENVKSRAIPETLGFVLEGVLHNDELSVDGKNLTDTCIYAKFM